MKRVVKLRLSFLRLIRIMRGLLYLLTQDYAQNCFFGPLPLSSIGNSYQSWRAYSAALCTVSTAVKISSYLALSNSRDVKLCKNCFVFMIVYSMQPGEVKVNHVMKAYWRSGGIAPRILELVQILGDDANKSE
jgi:hypothetical protein